MPPVPKCSHTEQEHHVLEAAVTCIEKSSLLDFTMSAIAKQANISIGSLYKHVQSKEDVLLALATQMYQHELKIFRQALELPLRPPEHIAAVALRNPNHIQCFSFSAHLNSLASCLPILQRGSSNWLNKMSSASASIKHLFEQYFLNAIEQDELLLDQNDNNLSQLNTGCWALCVGYDQVILHQHIRDASNHKKPLPFPLAVDCDYLKNIQRLVNCYPWQQGLSDEGINRAKAAMTAAQLR